ncbi:uncharacterized protein FFMR_05626 [Fusarium fujikuroi]|nr:uncharacterized protein FFMR_05626 [Fusarium fujikuroi]
MGGSRPLLSFLQATLILLFAGSLVGVSVKCPSSNLAEVINLGVSRGAKEYVLVCGYPTKGSMILQGSNIENAEDCLPEPEQGFAGNEEGFPDPEEGFPNPEERFPDPGTEEGFPELETGFPELDTEEGDLGPPSCPAAFAGLDIETAVRNSMEFCCPDALANYEALIKEYMAIVNSALNLIGKYCNKSCEPLGPLCFGLPLNPELIQIVDATASLKDLPQSSLAKENYVFNFDTLLGPRPFGRTFYRIRAGAELVIDFSAYEQDMVLSVADLYATLEQHAVFIDRKEIGRTYRALSLKDRGQNPYDLAVMLDDYVGDLPDGPAKSIIGRGL